MSTKHEEESALPLRGDSPLEDPSQDRFRRWEFAKRVADVIATRESPDSIVIGIHGAWGEGKTTTLNFMRKHLGTYSDVVLLPFNPWRYGDEESLLRGFFRGLADAIGKHLTKAEDVLEAIRAYSDALANAPLVPEPLKSLSSLITVAARRRSTVDLLDLRDRVNNALLRAGKRIVVLVDDIDRLEKAEVQAVFRLVKLCADFSRTAYVLAFDRNMVAAAVGEQYAFGDVEAGERFLEKIIQVPLHLPPVNVDVLTRMWWEHLQQALQVAGVSLESNQEREYARSFGEGLSPALRTARAIKRYANAITFALPLVRDEVNLVDLLLLEGLRVLYPSLYDHIRENLDAYLCQRDWPLGTTAETQEAREALRQRGIDKVPETQRRFAQKLLGHLFPQTVTAPEVGISEAWDRGKRVCSAYYADRYFTYGVAEGDIPDSSVLALVTGTDVASSTDLASQLEGLLKIGSAEALLRKLRYFTEAIEGRGAQNLALGMAIQMEHFTDEDHAFLRATPARDAGALIAQLCARAIPESRYETARQIVVDICSLGRADIIYYFLCRSKRTDLRGDLSDDECGELRDAFASRIAAEVKAGKVQILQLEGGASLFHVWAEAASDDVKEYLTLRFDGKPEEAVEFVALFCPPAYGPDGSHRSYFEATHYRYLHEIVDPEIVHQALIRHYGAQIDSGEYSAYAGRDVPTMRDLAGQFAYVHRHIEDM